MKELYDIEVMSHPAFFTQTQENVRYHFWDDKPISLHGHKHFEFFVVTENKLIHQFNGQKRILQKGTLGLIRPGDIHKMYAYKDEYCIHFNLSVAPSLFENLCQIVSPDLFNLINTQTEMITYVLSPEEYAYFDYAIKTAQVSKEEISQKNQPAIMRVMVHTFLLYLNSRLSIQSEQKVLPPWLNEFLEQLSNPEIFSLPLSKIYSLSTYSQPRLNTLFHEYTGTTLIDYITKQKVNYACNLLKTTTYKILTISNMTGFRSLSRFNCVFKNVTGKTPSQYREMYSIIALR